MAMQEFGTCFTYNLTFDISQPFPSNGLTFYVNLQSYEGMIGSSAESSLKVTDVATVTNAVTH